MKRRATAGFSLIEVLMVVAISGVLAAFAIPMTVNALKTYRLNAAVSSAAGAIQSSRYLAIMNGCSYFITFTPSTYSYRVTNSGLCANSYTGPVVPISGPDTITISRTMTLQFSANGAVAETTTPPSGVPQMVFTICQPTTTCPPVANTTGVSNTITTTSVGNVTVTSP